MGERATGRLGVLEESHPSVPQLSRESPALCACVRLQHRGGNAMMLFGSSSSGLMMKMMAMMSLVLCAGDSHGER